MPTNKNLFSRRLTLLALVATVVWMTGCGPPGPRALLEGKRLMERGEYPAAVERLQEASRLIGTNAQVWNYLGLAQHRAGQPAAAAEAYRKALKLDPDLVIAHYNLGCLLLEQNQPDKLEAAKDELTAYTLHQSSSAEGWLKLGAAQLRLRDAAGAERSFSTALQLSTNNPEALNGLGLVAWQRSRHRDAAAYFNNALARQPGYAPALLNLAVISQGYLNNRPLALQKYNEYLALNPRPADWDAVNNVAHQLELELNPSLRPATNLVATLTPPVTNQTRSASNSVLHGSPASNSTRVATSTPTRPVAEPGPTAPPEVVRVPEAPPLRVAANAGTPRPPDESSPPDDPGANGAEKPGFLERINPFRRDPKPVITPSPPPEPGPTRTDDSDASPATTLLPPRYSYTSPPKPAEGNRAEAERFFAQAAEAQHDRRLKDAIALYRAAIQADPSFFEAQSNLGLAAFDSGDLTQSLTAYETALAIKPDSFMARFKFALALGKASYIMDAAQELERLLAAPPPDETPAHLAMAHLALANLYAEQFRRPASARPHYSKVLELDPQNSQATAIRYWLKDHP